MAKRTKNKVCSDFQHCQSTFWTFTLFCPRRCQRCNTAEFSVTWDMVLRLRNYFLPYSLKLVFNPENWIYYVILFPILTFWFYSVNIFLNWLESFFQHFHPKPSLTLVFENPFFYKGTQQKDAILISHVISKITFPLTVRVPSVWLATLDRTEKLDPTWVPGLFLIILCLPFLLSFLYL